MLDSKAQKGFGPNNKNVKWSTSKPPKSGNYDKNYNYPSGAGNKTQLKIADGGVDQIKNVQMIRYFKSSEC